MCLLRQRRGRDKTTARRRESLCLCDSEGLGNIDSAEPEPPQQPGEAAASTRGGVSKGKCAQAQIRSTGPGSGIWKNEIKSK